MPKRAGSSWTRPVEPTRGSKPRTFWLHFNRINNQRGSPDIWTVHLSNQCVQTKKVYCNVPVWSVFKGNTARQPRAYFKGRGVITVGEGYVEIN